MIAPHHNYCGSVACIIEWLFVNMVSVIFYFIGNSWHTTYIKGLCIIINNFSIIKVKNIHCQNERNYIKPLYFFAKQDIIKHAVKNRLAAAWNNVAL